MAPRAPSPVSVRGGSNGIEAHYDQIVGIARLYGKAATDSGGAALSLHRYLADPAIATSALLDPGGVAVFEGDLLDALDGWHGLTWIAAQCGAIDVELRAAAAAYQQVDKLETSLKDHVMGLAGLPPAAAKAIADLIRTGNVSRAAQEILTGDPALVDELVNEGLIGVDQVLGPLYVDGRPAVADHGIDPAAAANMPPRSLTDVMAALALRDNGRHGEIDVRMMIGADGSRRVIVDIPGTKSWDPRPNGDVTSLSTNARALVGAPTTFERGVLSAMQKAGVRSSDDVMLVGHSEGGMVAVNLAQTVSKSGQFHVSHVVTAGAPIGLTVGNLPASVQVLALENHNDIVPHLDGATNPDKVNVTTVTINRGDGAVVHDHSLDRSYLPGAADVAASDDQSVRAFLAGANGFFDASQVQTNRYIITRVN